MNARVHNLLLDETQIELLVIIEISLAESRAVNLAEFLGEQRNYFFALFRTMFAVLLLINNAFANVPIG